MMNMFGRDKQGRGLVIFLTGLSGAGKTTIAGILADQIKKMTTREITLLDGDIVRQTLSKGLGFSKKDRNANIERAGLMANEAARRGGIAICSFVAPYHRARQKNRGLISQSGVYVEVFVSTPLEVCARRDPKGLYQKALAGAIDHFTGVSDPYEPPQNPEITINTVGCTPLDCVKEIIQYLKKEEFFKK